MRLHELLAGLPVGRSTADPCREVTGACCDSRRIEPGQVFVAIAGTRTDGHCWAAQARQRGAVCAVCTRPVEELPYVLVPDTRRALARMAGNFFRHPERQLHLIGITGTNGKSSTAWLTAGLLQDCLDTPVGLLGTGGCRIGGLWLPQERTTPEAWELRRLLRQMADSGCTHAVMEVSAHALSLHRVEGLRYEAAAFTNLSREHLDFYGSMERYRDAKAQLFRRCRSAVVNADDAHTPQLLRRAACSVYDYGIHGGALRAEDIRLSPRSVAFTAREGDTTAAARLAVPGLFSVYNALAALGICRRMGIPLTRAAAALERVPAVPGRMERVPTPGRDFTVLIDYAHTPQAMESALTAARPEGEGHLLLVFGCGGERDRGKRPLMGAAAARHAQLIVLTDDNPRREDPAAIIQDILPGLAGSDYRIIPNRRQAIRYALSQARPGDVLLLCGKGSEPFQERQGQKLPFDEREIVRQYIDQG